MRVSEYGSSPGEHTGAILVLISEISLPDMAFRELVDEAGRRRYDGERPGRRRRPGVGRTAG